MPVRRSYCTECDDYGHDAIAHREYDALVNKNFISTSMFHRLQVVKGEDDWWVNLQASADDGLTCLFCDKIIDWAPGDHEVSCPVRRFLRFEEE